MIYSDLPGSTELQLYINDIIQCRVSSSYDSYPVNNLTYGRISESISIFFINEKIKTFLLDNNIKVYGHCICDKDFFTDYELANDLSEYCSYPHGDRPEYSFYNILEIVDKSGIDPSNILSSQTDAYIVFDTKEQLAKFKILFL